MTTLPCRLLLLATVVAAIQASDAILDLVQIRDRGPRACWIIAENADEIRWRINPEATTESRTPRREVATVTYAFQRQGSAWTQGMEARERGRFHESAELFGQLATGDREAEQAVGFYEAGASWELAGRHDEAAAAFAKVTTQFATHPLALDARYRLGMALAMAKDAAQAEEIAKKLEEDGRGRLGQQANVRAAGVRAALALLSNNTAELRRQVSRASFSPANDRASWLHFNLYIADALRAAAMGAEAAPIYERMLPALAGDPAAAARVRLGIGLSRIDSDPASAIVELLSLDALPYGSPEQKCEARFHAGRLLAADAQTALKDPNVAKDERRAGFANDNLATARLLLQAAAESTADHSTKAQAAELLKTLPPDPLEEEAKAKAAAAAAAAAAAPKPAAPAKK